MPTQIFMIEMAPEAKPITAKEIQYYLYNTHFDSEFIVREMSKDALHRRQNEKLSRTRNADRLERRCYAIF